MTKLVVLKFSGSLESGFLVNSEIGQEGKSVDRGCTGKLPPAKELNYYLASWQQHYKRRLMTTLLLVLIKYRLRLSTMMIRHLSRIRNSGLFRHQLEKSLPLR